MSFIRLHVTAEGQTEEGFVKQILSKHLGGYQIAAYARSVFTSRNRRRNRIYCGGLSGYEKVKRDILTWMKEQNRPECRFTTMFDLYALPDDFPGMETVKNLSDPYEKVRKLESALEKDIGNSHFLPYIQLHEFEALVLAAPQNLECVYLDHESAIRRLSRILEAHGGNPELIDEGKETAPSKRIRKEIPEYDKVTAGTMAVKQTGMPMLRQKCRHFNDWITRLEQLSESS